MRSPPLHSHTLGGTAMSAARTRLSAAVLTAALVGTAVLLPTAAHAAAPAPALTMTLTGPSSNVPFLVPGGKSENIELDVNNDSATPQPFHGELSGAAKGALGIVPSDLTFSLVPENAGTPATGAELDGQDSGLLGAFYPRGGKFGDSFTIPAHTRYSWLITIGAARSWPVNNSGLSFTVLGGRDGSPHRSIDIKVGEAGTGGPMVESLSGGNDVAPGRPLLTTLTVTNRTGAALAHAWPNQIVFGSDRHGDISSDTRLAADLWDGAHWQPLKDGQLPTLPAGFAKGASVSYQLRVRVTEYHAKAASGLVSMFVRGGGGPGTTFQATKELTVHKVAPSAGAPSTSTASPSPSATTAAPSATASAPASASAAASAPASAAATAAGSLAHTGGGSSTGLLAGAALALLGAGLAVMVGLRNRRRH